MTRDELLFQIELRIERLFNDDMVFEDFLFAEQDFEDYQLANILKFDDVRFYNFIDSLVFSV